MKNRFDLWLLLLFFGSVPVCLWAGGLDIRWLLILPGLPVFFLQLLLCRRTGELGIRILPAALLLLFALSGGLILLVTSGWDALLGLIMLWSSVSPAVGIVLGWGGYLLHIRVVKRKEADHG